MPTPLLIITILFANCCLFAQEFTPFDLSDGTIWQESYQLGLGDTPGSQGYETSSYSYLLNGDTLANGHPYKKVYSRIDWEASTITYYTGPDEYETVTTAENYDYPYHLIGALRQDVKNQRLYFINWIESSNHFSHHCHLYIPPLGEEVLIYDFKVAPGDSVWIGDLSRIVLQVGTVLMTDGSTRKSVLLSNGAPLWVAELGGEFGLFSSLMSVPNESGCFLLCYNGETPSSQLQIGGYYTGNMAEHCDQQIIVSTSEELNKLPNIQLIPNPANDYVELKYPQSLIDQQAQIHIFNSIGQQMNIQALSKPHTIIPIQTWANGLYFLHIVADGRVINVQKLIKQ
jgi:hypothetical protein